MQNENRCSCKQLVYNTTQNITSAYTRQGEHCITPKTIDGIKLQYTRGRIFSHNFTSGI